VKIVEDRKKCITVKTVNWSAAMILPRAGIAWLALLLAAPLCFAQEQSKAGQDLEPAALVHQVPPDYPDAWKREGLQGTVHLRATIAKDGTLQAVTVLDGDARLAKSAEKAVKKWRYKPKMLKGEPVEVQTTIAVVFALKPAT
jgi:TonB family protein